MVKTDTFTSYESASTRTLTERWAKASVIPEDMACDNRSDINCCDYCGVAELHQHLVARVVDLTVIEKYIRHYTRGLMTGREFREYVGEELDRL